MDKKIARKRFCEQRSQARGRKIPFEMSFEQWCSIWEQSGQWQKRGRGIGKYVMSRKGDQGSYSIDNVFIQLWEQNNKDTWTEEKLSQANVLRSQKLKGQKRFFSEDHKEKLSIAAKNRWLKKKTEIYFE